MVTYVRGNTREIVLGVALAQLLRERGLEAEAEQSLTSKARRHQVDVLVELSEFAIAIEAEFAPGRTVRDDAEKRLPKTSLLWRGLSIEFVFALVYPESLKAVPESQAREALARIDSLRFAIVSRRDTSESPVKNGDHLLGTWQRGGVPVLAEYLHDFWVRNAKGGSVEGTISLASTAIEEAAEVLRRSPGRQSIAAADSDPEATCALIWLNALLFQELLCAHLDPKQLEPRLQVASIPKPDRKCRPGVLLGQWEAILDVNWWPIFHVAREALKPEPTRHATLALQRLAEAASTIGSRGVIQRHDIAGRIFHRLLDSRKFLATNYTTIPAAVLLAGLAFDRDCPIWKRVDWASPTAVSGLRIVDPACGSGTLLMAALQEILKLYRRAGGSAEKHGETIRIVLEHVVHGYDVVPAAVHLTAATLALAEMRQIISNMPLYWMPHDVWKSKARMGSLDFLKSSPGGGQAQYLALFPSGSTDPGRMTGEGERVFDAVMPSQCDLFIANPPYTRAGGPGRKGSTTWNPVFGSALSRTDAQVMQQALRHTLSQTPASLYAGLGSAFTVLASERVRVGGRLAMVLPATALTGSRWAPIREMLLDEFHVEWVIVSHDSRNRPKRKGLPGRRFVGFSESTRIAETLIVATKVQKGSLNDRSFTRFVNLRKNPDEAIDAMAITRALLALPVPDGPIPDVELVIGEESWGEVLTSPKSRLRNRPWSQSTFCQGRLADAASELAESGTLRLGELVLPIPIANLSALCALGPYHMQIKNPNQGLFEISETSDPTRAGHPALWHHRADRITTLKAKANARLRERQGRGRKAQSEMLARAGRLQLASDLGHAPQRVAAVITNEAMIGVRSWITLLPKKHKTGKEEALCLWLNSTPGLLLRIFCANRPYLGRSAVSHEAARTLPVLDVDALSREQRQAAVRLFQSLEHERLRGFAHLADDERRRELDHRLFGEVLGYEAVRELDWLARTLNREPTLTARH